MDKCNCYHENYGRQECWGTKERDECSCSGDETKCNFYQEKREYTYEETKEQFETIWNTNAYIGICESSDVKNVIKALEKQIPNEVVSEGDDEDDWVHCPCCNEILGVNESVFNAFYDNNYKPIYCHKCGQSLILE